MTRKQPSSTSTTLKPGGTPRSRTVTDGIEAALKQAADKLLANTVIENYRIEKQ